MIFVLITELINHCVYTVFSLYNLQLMIYICLTVCILCLFVYPRLCQQQHIGLLRIKEKIVFDAACFAQSYLSDLLVAERLIEIFS